MISPTRPKPFLTEEHTPVKSETPEWSFRQLPIPTEVVSNPNKSPSADLLEIPSAVHSPLAVVHWPIPDRKDEPDAVQVPRMPVVGPKPVKLLDPAARDVACGPIRELAPLRKSALLPVAIAVEITADRADVDVSLDTAVLEDVDWIPVVALLPVMREVPDAMDVD